MRLLAGFTVAGLILWVMAMVEMSHNEQTRRIR